jgi:hypothetical protein
LYMLDTSGTAGSVQAERKVKGGGSVEFQHGRSRPTGRQDSPLPSGAQDASLASETRNSPAHASCEQLVGDIPRCWWHQVFSAVLGGLRFVTSAGNRGRKEALHHRSGCHPRSSFSSEAASTTRKSSAS